MTDRVLFVDDEQRVLDGLRRALRGWNSRWVLHFADSGRAALALMATISVDVVVSDFRMPAMDGRELLETVRRLHPDTTRLVLSGHADEADLLDVVAVAHQFLHKPCNTPRLVDAIDGVLWARDELRVEPIRAEIGAIETLPATPGALRDLVGALECPEVSTEAVAAAVEGDMALTVQVLRLVNSALFSAGRPVTNVTEAIQRLGLDVVRSVALMLDDARHQQLREALPPGFLERLNGQARATALLARRLARREEAADAFCAGLVRECGQLALALCCTESFRLQLDVPAPEVRLWAEEEPWRLGLIHARAGAYLLSLWGYPRSFVEAVAGRDRPLDAGAAFPFTSSDAVQVAHQVVGYDLGGSCRSPGGVTDEELDARGALGLVQEWRAQRAALEADAAA